MDGKKEELLAKIKADIEAANRYYESDVEPLLLERSKIYHGDKKPLAPYCFVVGGHCILLWYGWWHDPQPPVWEVAR